MNERKNIWSTAERECKAKSEREHWSYAQVYSYKIWRILESEIVVFAHQDDIIMGQCCHKFKT